jgi:hemerythrin-like domain-containing protein
LEEDMTRSSFKLDMTMMFTIHDAFRRELERIAKITVQTNDDPKHILRAAIGWQMFKQYLRIHHTTEDETVWGLMEQELADRPSDLALLAAMEAEHAAIDPLLNAIDVALADRDKGPEQLGGLVDELATSLGAHLKHEEAEGLALVDSTLTEQQWANFAAVHLKRVGDDVGTYLPWLLDSASEKWTETVLSRLPEHGVIAYRDKWRAAYAELDLWTPGPERVNT